MLLRFSGFSFYHGCLRFSLGPTATRQLSVFGFKKVYSWVGHARHSTDNARQQHDTFIRPRHGPRDPRHTPPHVTLSHNFQLTNVLCRWYGDDDLVASLIVDWTDSSELPPGRPVDWKEGARQDALRDNYLHLRLHVGRCATLLSSPQ